MYNKEEEEYVEFFAKKWNKINAWETQGRNTRVTNANEKHGNQLTKISPHNKYDGTRISRHKQNDPPKKDFPYSLARPYNERQMNKGGN